MDRLQFLLASPGSGVRSMTMSAGVYYVVGASAGPGSSRRLSLRSAPHSAADDHRNPTPDGAWHATAPRGRRVEHSSMMLESLTSSGLRSRTFAFCLRRAAPAGSGLAVAGTRSETTPKGGVGWHRPTWSGWAPVSRRGVSVFFPCLPACHRSRATIGPGQVGNTAWQQSESSN